MKRTTIFLFFFWFAISQCVQAQRKMEYTPSPLSIAQWNQPGNLNPILPGYFADPTIRKFGDTYYIYATTDGTGNGYGPAQVWVSKDFRNWKNVILNWPTTEVVWAPDVVQMPDGRYRYYYCEPCNINVGESDTPLGPWRNILGKSDAQLVPDRYVHNAITLDPQLFRDDDGREYLYFTTWGIYDGFGCGVARLNPNYDGKNKVDARGWNENNPRPIAADAFFDEKRLIPNTELKDIFEAPFVFKRKGIYYFTYSSGSCHTDTYRVQYAISKVGPMGPFEYKGELLTSNYDGTVHGPGHHSILQDGKDFYIVYHRHDIAKAIHGFNRQVCIDKLEFNKDGSIRPVVPTHDGVLPTSLTKKKTRTAPNLAYQMPVSCSSYYSDMFGPEKVVDDNNATLWKADRYPNMYRGLNPQREEWVQIDLGEVKDFNQVWTQFEYATFFYQYRILISDDGEMWHTYADRRDNTTAGSPMIDAGEAQARYIRICISDTQKNGHFAAIWNVKVFNASEKDDPRLLLPNTDDIDLSAVEAGYPRLHLKDVEPEERKAAYDRGFRVVDINADDYGQGRIAHIRQIMNRCGGQFEGGDVIVEIKKGKYAFYFDGEQALQSTFGLPKTMTYNAPYTMCAWVLNPQVGGIETLAEFTQRRNDLATIEFRQGTDPQNGLVAHNASFENFGCPQQCREGEGEWQFWAVSYDGYMERVYCNGKLVREKNSFLMIRPEGNITLGASMDGGNKFSGYIHSLRFWDRGMSGSELEDLMNEKSDTEDRITFDEKDLQLGVEVLTPDYIRMKVTDRKGEPLRTGLLTVSYDIVPGKVPGTRLCRATITDDEGTINKTLERTVTVDPAQFAIREHAEPIRLAGSGPNFNEDPTHQGARVLEEVTGDFIVQARVSDFDGVVTHNVPAYNEAGIILLENDHSFIQNGIFPLYNCGNMLTQVRRGRPQFPVNNGYDYDPYVQLQRQGDLVYARRSRDGVTWVDMPGSPLRVSSATLQVGVYQTTYTDHESWAEIRDFRLVQKK